MMRTSYLEMMRAHVDDGGSLSHQNGVDLLAEIERLTRQRDEAKAELARIRGLPRLAALDEENRRLTRERDAREDALSWIADYDPEMVNWAREKFALKASETPAEAMDSGSPESQPRTSR